jgi:hypothetical protein
VTFRARCGATRHRIDERDNMTTREMMETVGRDFLMTSEGLTFLVTVEDMKVAYGQRRALVHPAAGIGSKWVAFDRLRPHVPGNLFAV